ncbi:MAG: hypothetical protein AAFY98_04395, partial [Verrucomicrobiota bacterium]
MKKLFIGCILSLSLVVSSNAQVVILGAIDGDLSLDGNGGDPKALLLQVTSDNVDLSMYNVGVSTNGGTSSDGPVFTLSGTANTNDVVVISADATHQTFLQGAFSGNGLTT